MQDGECDQDARHVGSRDCGGHERHSPQERQQRPQARAGDNGEHRNDEQDVAHAVVDRRTLDDEKSQRQDDGQSNDKNGAVACKQGCR